MSDWQLNFKDYKSTKINNKTIDANLQQLIWNGEGTKNNPIIIKGNAGLNLRVIF